MPPKQQKPFKFCPPHCMPDSFTPPIQTGVMRQLWRCQRRHRLTAAGSDELTEAAAHMYPLHPN